MLKFPTIRNLFASILFAGMVLLEVGCGDGTPAGVLSPELSGDSDAAAAPTTKLKNIQQPKAVVAPGGRGELMMPE